jgi:hypothetical protein
MSIEEAREFMRLHLGDDWVAALIQARAMAGPEATNEQIDEAQQRAVELVSGVVEGWTLETREAAAEGWRVVFNAQT